MQLPLLPMVAIEDIDRMAAVCMMAAGCSGRGVDCMVTTGNNCWVTAGTDCMVTSKCMTLLAEMYTLLFITTAHV